METFFKTLLIILLVYFGLKILFRLAMPFIMRFIAKKAGQKMEQAFKSQYGYQQTRDENEGETVIGKKQQKRSQSKKPVGEYVDYEEID
ncbi:DUF4834 family protein [Planktosalinus lacus]|uniref:DUF4834 domain-containing protein n=1 Tax=Planktosalinus lacus TaxID=1526573 RepID=A0A8J2Y7U8_9FLAO|nr:DUF4834 family protein [Planktosalinus lacus]GGD98565.1 hypothetical protein GCM10011312_22590 [Planktosalinus lacus]